MTKPKETIWEIEQHTLAKHEILQRYLGAWFPILHTTDKRLVYLDGFCGPGRYKGGEDGSPIIALKVAESHSEILKNDEVLFYFSDNEEDRIRQLEFELKNIKVPSNFRINTIVGDFDKILGNLLKNSDSSGIGSSPTFAFIDPFGFKGIPFQLIRQLLSNNKTEVFINIMIRDINRFLDHPDPQTRQHILVLLGDQKALDIVRSSANRITALRNLYQANLKKSARFVRYFEMKDIHNKTIYCLFFASNHPLGYVKMKEAFWKVDTSSGFQFSDATNPNQYVLFNLDPSDELSKEIMNKFDGITVDVERIRIYVENETPYTSMLMRRSLKSLESNGVIQIPDYKKYGQKRKKNTYPDDVIVSFNN